ncbi:Putative phosphofructokinase pfkB [Dietzia sp. DQ12-45-1b]|nr:Putative phosphofructokinase pfkB [Dietzia sp. DQ12-45-1b]
MDPDEAGPRGVSGRVGHVVIFAPSPVLTITVEDHDGDVAIHLHPGGQGVWQARMVRALGTEVTLCAGFAGETGTVLQHLIRDEGFRLVAVERKEGYGAAYIHDRRQGSRRVVADTKGDSLSRHDLDRLYGLTLREAIGSDVVLLSGPAGGGVVPADVYRRLAADLRTCRCRVMVDLIGERLDSALQGGVDVVKVSHEELLADGRISSVDVREIVSAMHAIRSAGAETVIVTRAEKGLLLLDDEGVREVVAPAMQVEDSTGAGDSFTAATAAVLARGSGIEEAVSLGAAAGALNVTRHGLGTGELSTIRRFSEFVQISPYDWQRPPEVRITPAQLSDFIRRG